MSRLKVSPSESRVQSTHFVLPQDANALGTIFGGTLMAWMDLAAATCALRHCRTTAVTVSVDQLHFHSPILVGHVVNIEAFMTYVSFSSMEILVNVEGENPYTNSRKKTCSAFFTFVARSPDGKKVQVPELLLQSEAERKFFQEGKHRHEMRLQSSNQKQGGHPP